jgi:uncharacterized protein YecE (DUF72 family)
MAKKIYVGCSGFSYNEWRGVFYPYKVPKELWLEHYKKYFSTVELNFTFYKFPAKNIIQSLVLKAPHLKFSVKVHQKFTHRRNYEEKDVEHFLEGLKLLTEKGNLVALLFQFPESFKFNEQNLDYLEKLHYHFVDFTQAMEFRHKSWMNREFFRWLDERNITIVNIDAPKEIGWPVGPWVSTGEINYFRFHGRNPERLYDYLYTEEELDWLLKKVLSLYNNKPTYVYFNNTVGAKCVANAIKFKMMLGVWNENIPIPNAIRRMWIEKEYE